MMLLATTITNALALIVVTTELVFLVIPETATMETCVPTILVICTQANARILLTMLIALMATLVLWMMSAPKDLAYRVIRKNVTITTCVPMILVIVGWANAYILITLARAPMVMLALCMMFAKAELV